MNVGIFTLFGDIINQFDAPVSVGDAEHKELEDEDIRIRKAKNFLIFSSA